MELRLIKRQLTAACHYSYVRLVLNFYMYCESSVGPNRQKTPGIKAFYNRYTTLLSEFLEGNADCESLSQLRGDVTADMETATAYTDSFQAYEYIMNRLEGRFLPQLVGKEAENCEKFTAELMSYITDGQDAMMVNERIRTVMGQLPVRLTKQKFFAFLEEGFSVYKGGPSEGLKDMLYILRSEALLFEPRKASGGYETLFQILGEFKNADYSHMSAASYQQLSLRLQTASEQLTEYSEEIVLLMDLINDLYVLMLSREEAVMEVSEEQRMKVILKKLLALSETPGQTSIPEELTDSLVLLEGKQEQYFEQWSRASIEEADTPLEQKLWDISLLLSGSSFASLERGEGSQKAVDSQTLKKEFDTLKAELMRSWENSPKVLVRAVMSKLLSGLPVFFHSLEEVSAYIKNSLELCGDETEKRVCMRLLRSLIEEEQ